MMGPSSLSPLLSVDQARQLAPLQLAFVGDAVHALLVRTQLMGRNLKVHDMHLQSTRAVNAVSQARAMERIFPLLSQQEADIVRRGRNAHPHHGAPKSASVTEYAWATGLEALLGYLYLTGQLDRLNQLRPYLQPEDHHA